MVAYLRIEVAIVCCFDFKSKECWDDKLTFKCVALVYFSFWFFIPDVRSGAEIHELSTFVGEDSNSFLCFLDSLEDYGILVYCTLIGGIQFGA